MSSFEASALNTTVSHRFEHIVQVYADQPAIQTDTRSCTYDTLNQRANQIAYTLLLHCGPQQAQVGILCSDVLWQIAALLAVIKTGKTVVMFDFTLPDQRLKQIIEDAQTEVILFDEALTAQANALTQTPSPISSTSIEANKPIQQICVDLLPPSTPPHNPGMIYAVTTPLAIIYTSGSSGQPKGIVRSHQAQMQGIWANQQRLKTVDNAQWAITSTLAYAAAWSIAIRSLVSGGCIHYYDAASKGTSDLSNWLYIRCIQYFSPPLTFLKQWCHDLLQAIHLPHLQIVTLVGTTIHKADFVQLSTKVHGNYMVVNNYGATETLATSCYAIHIKDVASLSEGIIPVGTDMDNKQTLIYAANGDQVASGQAGEVVIKSKYLAQYWRSPQLNYDKFLAVPNEPDMSLFFTGDFGYQDEAGCLHLVGRKDFMVKIRGYRVDLSEIEHAMMKIPDIAMAMAIAYPPPDPSSTESAPILLAYVLPRPNTSISPSQIYQNLSLQLPDPMLPRHIILVDQLPLLPNGKVDRQALAQRKVAFRRSLPAHYLAPRNALETQLANIWASVLNIYPIGIDEVFLDLGGNSLQAMQIINLVLRELQIKISIQTLISSATIRLMALAIVQAQAKQIAPDLLERLLTEIEQSP